MKFTETKLRGAFVIEPEPVTDERGFFARTWCEREFDEHALHARFVQCSISFNVKRGTLRGMHYQTAPCEEVKLVRCTRGALHDVIIDLRSDSPTFTQHVAVVLTAENRKMMYVPQGFAHGFQTLEDNSEVFYQISEFHHPDHAAGVACDDPAFGIEWPVADRIMSERDRNLPRLRMASLRGDPER
jgi:dTDP-4-dehydrorhamnose 3,5-epimerase